MDTPAAVNAKITREPSPVLSGFYGQAHKISGLDTGGMILRDWLSTMSFEEQYEWGIWVLRYFGVNV